MRYVSHPYSNVTRLVPSIAALPWTAKKFNENNQLLSFRRQGSIDELRQRHDP
jgi:hypothetical protein